MLLHLHKTHTTTNDKTSQTSVAPNACYCADTVPAAAAVVALLQKVCHHFPAGDSVSAPGARGKASEKSAASLQLSVSFLARRRQYPSAAYFCPVKSKNIPLVNRLNLWDCCPYPILHIESSGRERRAGAGSTALIAEKYKCWE